MPTTSLLLAAALLFPAQDRPADGPPPPEPERVEAALEELRDAFAKDDPAARIRAIEAGREVLDPDVVEAIERGLRDESENVRGAAVTALRWMRHPAALKALHAELARVADLERGADDAVSVVKAIGEHGSVTSIPVLTKDLFRNTDRKLVRARILALGNVRSTKSVEALFDLMRVAGVRRVQPYMDDFRLALVVLTGADEGRSQDAWTRWWNANKKELRVLPEPPELARADARAWYAFWDRRPMEQRQKRRGERGDDADGRGRGER